MFHSLFHRKQTVQHLFFQTDMHCHLLPGIDDGQESAEGGAYLVEKEVEWGIRRIICTPHITQDTFENTPETISAAFRALKEVVEQRGIDIHLDYSAEHRLDAYFQSEVERGAIKPLPNNYLLVENPFIQEAWDLDNRLFDLRIKGYRPILAHPERYAYYFTKPERYKQLHAAGTLFQVNLLSLAGYYGKEVRRISDMLIENDLVDFVGTDMHNDRHSATIERYMQSRDYRAHAQLLENRILNDKVL